MEYESRRDSDDAYHEMHNVRLGRSEDVLKIEVSDCAHRQRSDMRVALHLHSMLTQICFTSGHAHLLLHPGASIRPVAANVILAHHAGSVRLHAVGLAPHQHEAENTLLAKKSAASETTIVATAASVMRDAGAGALTMDCVSVT